MTFAPTGRVILISYVAYVRAMHHREINLHQAGNYIVDFAVLTPLKSPSINPLAAAEPSGEYPLRKVPVHLVRFFIDIFKKQYRVSGFDFPFGTYERGKKSQGFRPLARPCLPLVVYRYRRGPRKDPF